jgi:hypothetical protein
MSIELNWKSPTPDEHLLYRRGSTSPVLTVVADTTYAAMWRIKTKDGRLSDMANIVRIRDAAIAIATAEYAAQRQFVRPREAPYSAPAAKQVPSQPTTTMPSSVAA